MSTDDDAFHVGERAVQARYGVEVRLREIGPRVLRDHMPEQHRVFFESLPFVVLGGMDRHGDLFATIAHGAPGFVQTPADDVLVFAPGFVAGDPIADAFVPGAPLGLLGIELPTRRRNRMNGHVVARDPTAITVHVDQSFGNCPRHIHPRTPRAFARQAPSQRVEGAALSEAALGLVRHADTFFIATSSGKAAVQARARGVDVSHRGGPKGFVRATMLDGATVLTVPDYDGNYFFNTLGNLELHPYAGLLFVDFEHGTMLHLTTSARVLFERAQGGENEARAMELTVRRGVLLEGALPLKFREPA
jgi:predicted pyridoxine 5'-phosphate oxidase superfamily flavin-nucleotide-binding protein